MPTLHELQTRLAAAVIGGGAARAAALVVDDAPGAAARIAIYANHFRVTLIDALASTFPVVRRLVGEDFFNAAAREYIREHPPAGPCLFEYGAHFPPFLAQLPAAASLGWLADVATLEWAISCAWHAPDAAPLDHYGLLRLAADGGDVVMSLHPSCRLVVSPFPVDRIWQAHQASGDDIDPIDLDTGGVRLLVHRQGGDVGWLRLGEEDVVCVAALLEGNGIGSALASAADRQTAFHLTPLLAALLSAGLVVSAALDGSPKP